MFEKKNYKLVGESSLRISPVTLGTMTFGEQNTQKEAFDQLNYALSNGINSFDVAELYPVPPKEDTCSRTETIMGNWIKKQARDQIIISTKIAGPRRGLDWIRGGPESLDEKNIFRAVDDSLKRMQTDYVDLLYLHWPERNVPMFGQYKFDPVGECKGEKKIDWVTIEAQLNSLGKLVSSGKVRFIALSNEYPWGVMEFLRIAREKNLPIISCVQNGYSLLNRIAELGLTEIFYRENIGFMAYSPLAFGHLTGKYILNQSTKGRVTLFKGYAQRYNKPGVFNAVKKYMEIAEKFNITPTEMALSFVYHQWFVTSTVVGATSINQLKQNLEAFQIKLSSELIEEIELTHLSCMNPAP